MVGGQEGLLVESLEGQDGGTCGSLTLEGQLIVGGWRLDGCREDSRGL